MDEEAKPKAKSSGTKEASGVRTNKATTEAEKDLSALELKKYELEKYKVESTARLEFRRYALERYKANREQKFLNRNLGIIISAAISLSAVLVSLGQVWVAKISKDKELEVALLQKQAETERLDKQRDKELTIQVAEQERQWNLNRARFIADNKKILFEGRPEELKRMTLLIETLFPPDIAATMFEDLKSTAASPEAQRVWTSAQERIQKRVRANPTLTNQSRTVTPPPISTPDGSLSTGSTSSTASATPSTAASPNYAPYANYRSGRSRANCPGGQVAFCDTYKCICEDYVGCIGYDSQGNVVENSPCSGS